MKYHEDIAVFGIKSPRYYPQMVKVEGRKVKKRTNNGYQGFNKGLEKPEYIGKVYTDKYPSSIIEFSNAVHTSKYHPTQKQVALFEYLIKTYTNEGDLVLDNCAGSGTTGVACRNLNRRCILIEKEEKYIEIINSRIFSEDSKELELFTTIVDQKDLFY